MEENKEALNKSTKNNSSGTVPLSDIFFMTLRHWPWILVSVFICVGVAYLYLLRTPNVYTRSAEILIKEDKKGQSAGSEEFAKLGLFQTRTNIRNEVSNLKAKDLMEEVVKRLCLDINYYHPGKFHDMVAYGYNLPVKLTISGFPDNGRLSMNLSVSKDGKVIIKDLKESTKEPYKGTYTGKLNDTIATPEGKIVVSPTPCYSKGEEISLIVNKNPMNAVRDSYNGRLGVTLTDEEGTVLRLTITDQSPQRADDVLNTLITVYNENWIRDKNQIAFSTSNFINDRLGVIENELGNVDSDISSYKSANLIPDVDAAATMYMSQSQQTQAQILEVNNQLSIARYVRSYLSAEGNHDQLLTANTGLQNSNILALIGEYNAKLLQRNSLIAKSSEKNPLVAQLDEQLNAQRQAVIRSIDNEIVLLNTRLKSLRGSEAQTMSRIASNPQQAKNLLSTERQQKVKESLYLFLLQKREENELSQAFSAYNTRIVNKPGASGVPPSPNRGKILAMAFLLGLAIPFGWTYTRETLNTKVRGRKDIEDLLPPFLGEIPMFDGNLEKGKFGKKKQIKAIVVKDGKRDIINEAFRVLRTNLEFMKIHKDEADVITITSFNPGSGKSFLTMNLGVALALNNQKVLIIDGDMRHGSASAFIDSPDKGLSDVLSGRIHNVNEAIVIVRKFASLNILPVGTVPPNPTELLKTQRFVDIIEELRKQYDYILIDCPPIEVVADAQIINKDADRTIFVLRAGLLERSMLPQLDKLYEEDKYKNMSIILNGTSSGHGRYGYSHSYKYGYGYGYGYGYNYDGKNGKKHKSGRDNDWKIDD